MSFTSVDLPDPLTPVTAVNVPSGIATSMFFRLFARAPRMTISPFDAGRLARGSGNRALAAQVRAGERPDARRQQLRRLALEDDVSAVLSGAGSQVHDVVGGADRFFVVLDDNDGVSEVAKTRQRRQQPPIVALVQANRRLVEHVEHAGEVGADLRRQPDALSLTAGQRGGASIERQVPDADVIEESQTLANLSAARARPRALRARSARRSRTPPARR